MRRSHAFQRPPKSLLARAFLLMLCRGLPKPSQAFPTQRTLQIMHPPGLNKPKCFGARRAPAKAPSQKETRSLEPHPAQTLRARSIGGVQQRARPNCTGPTGSRLAGLQARCLEPDLSQTSAWFRKVHKANKKQVRDQSSREL